MLVTRGRVSLFGALALAAVHLVAGTVIPAAAASRVAVGAEFTALPHFGIAGGLVGGGERFGSLDYAGGFEVTASGGLVGGLSSLVVAPGGDRLVAISDDGVALTATILRDGAGRPVGWDTIRLSDLEILGQRQTLKSDTDAEGFDVAFDEAGGAVAYVSFEGSPRIGFAPLGADDSLGPLRKMDLPRDVGRIDGNAGFESVAVAPAGSALAGSFVAIAETDPTGGADAPGWIFRRGTADQRSAPGFTVALSDGYAVTDAAFLPDGDLLVLERRFGFTVGIGMRIRRIAGDTIRAGARLDGEVLIEANLAHQIDNMEGLSVWRDAAGRTRLSLVSDDNHSFLQRTLYLEFVLAE